MNKQLMEQLELEKRKRDVIKQAQGFRKEEPEIPKPSIPLENKKFAWEYELERYKKDRLRERFYFVGSVCGILALVSTLFFHASEWMSWF